MKTTLIAAAALSLLAVGTPASAQDHGWRHRHHHSGVTVDVGRAYARSNCSVRITKVHRPNGTVVTRRVRRCD